MLYHVLTPNTLTSAQIPLHVDSDAAREVAHARCGPLSDEVRTQVLQKHHKRDKNRPFRFDSASLDRLSDVTGELNDVCINDGARVLLSHFAKASPTTFALFSSYDISSVRNGGPARIVLQSAKRSECWNRDIWVLPVHQGAQHHWTLIVVRRSTLSIHHFDSFASEKTWKEDVKVRSNFFARNQRSTYER